AVPQSFLPLPLPARAHRHTSILKAKHFQGQVFLAFRHGLLKKQVFKRLALKYLCDSRQDIKDQIAREIEEGQGGTLTHS
ncbi:MAG: hypothetical protein ABSH47_18805, partial [Bryobacteraceae bacterium]